MPNDSRLFDCATQSIVSSLYQLHRDLDPMSELGPQVTNFTNACRSLAIEGKVMRGGTTLEGEEAVTYWNGLYTKLQQSVPPSSPGGSTATAELIGSQYGALKRFTQDYMNNANQPTWVQKTTDTVKVDARTERRTAIRARDGAILAMRRDLRSLKQNFGGAFTNGEGAELHFLTSAVKTYADRAQIVGGLPVELVTIGDEGVSQSRLLDREGCSQFMGAMSLALRKAHLEPLGSIASFDQPILDRIADSVIAIEHTADDLLVALQKLDDIDENSKQESYTPRITMSDVEYREANSLYQSALIAGRHTPTPTLASET